MDMNRAHTQSTSAMLAALGAYAVLACAPVFAMDRGKQVVLTRKDDAARMIDAVENAAWAADGQVGQKPVYIVYNTECPWSKRLFEETRALTGKVQFRWIPAMGNGATDVVTQRDGAAVAQAFAGRHGHGGDAGQARRAVDYNGAVQISIDYQLRAYDKSKTFAYPTLVYRTAQGVKVVAGNPKNLAALPGEVMTQRDKAGLTPAALGIAAQPVQVARSRNLSKWYHDKPVPEVFRAAPSLQAAPVDDLAKGYMLPVTGIVVDGGWIELAPWPKAERRVYVHDPLMARLAMLDFRVRPQGGNWDSTRSVQVLSFPDAEAPVLETLGPGVRYRRSGVVELDGRVWDQIVLYVDGTKGYVMR